MVPAIVGKAVTVAERLSAPLRVEMLRHVSDLEMRLSCTTLLPQAIKQICKELSECKKHLKALFLSKKERSSALSCATVSASLKEFSKLCVAKVNSSYLTDIKDVGNIFIVCLEFDSSSVQT